MNETVKRAARRVLPPSVVARVRASRESALLHSFHPYVAEHSYGGHMLSISMEDPLGQGWYDHDWPALPEVDLLLAQDRLRPGLRVFDLGAHQCVVALMLAAEVGASGKVIAVEATGHNVQVAERNLALNGATNVVIRRAAAADAEGTISFCERLNGHLRHVDDSFTTTDVCAVTIDSLAREYGSPDLVFVDVEGSEELVLRGARATFETHPDWVVEVHSGVGLESQGGSVPAVIQAFAGRGYRLWLKGETAPEFQPYEGRHPEGRFHLVALSGRATETSASPGERRGQS